MCIFPPKYWEHRGEDRDFMAIDRGHIAGIYSDEYIRIRS